MTRKQKILTTIAAVLCLSAIGAGLWAALRSPAAEPPVETPGGQSDPDAPVESVGGPMSYAGPVLPLTVLGGELTADRTVTVDLSREKLAAVTDRYAVTNETDTDQTVILLYPFAGEFTSPAEIIPTLTVDGEPLQTELAAGDYAASFMNIDGRIAQTPEEMYNLGGCQSASDYGDHLKDEAYLLGALEESPLLHTPVVIYTPELPGEHNAAAEFSCTLPDGVTIIPIGYHSAAGEGSRLTYTFRTGYNRPAELMVLGGDVTEIAADLPYTRTETTLGDHLPALITYPLGYQPEYESIADRADDALKIRTAARWLDFCGPFGTAPAIRYEMGLDILGDLWSVDRIFFLTANVTVPAGETVTVEASMHKEAGFQYGSAAEEYELYLWEPQGLTLSSQLLNLEGTEDLTIVSRETVTIPLEFGRTTDIDLQTGQDSLWLKIQRP